MAQTTGGGSSSNPPDAQSVISYLNQTILWYRQLTVQQEAAGEPSDIVFLNQNRQLADQVVRLSFDFARADAQLLNQKGGGNTAEANAGSQGGSRYQSLVAMADKADQQVKARQQELAGMRAQLEAATGRRRRTLASTIAETQSELDLAQARRDSLRSMLEFVSGRNMTGMTSGSLQAEIEDLARTVPAAATDSKTGVSQPVSAATANTRKPEPSGILAILTDLFGLRRRIRTLDQGLEQTAALANVSKGLRTPLINNLRDLIKRGDQLSNEPDSTDSTVLAQQKQQLDQLTAQFKQLSGVVLPLAKQAILLDLYTRSLSNWRESVHSQYVSQLKSLALRLAVLAVILGFVFVLSSVWRKATFRYVQDARRRYQFLLLRRIVVWALIAMVVAVAFASELGTLATFAGLLTAGIAVALQNVILSVAGYFFLIGKYGVRVGDRVQISGVTGEVVDIGLVRLHLMEIGKEATPTGRMVVFSNSVVFQPTAGLFKQIPGTRFDWHEITLTLAAESDYHKVEERLTSAVTAVFENYRERMEGQRRRMEQSLGPVSGNSLHPETRLRLTQSGLEVVIRYPVELDDANKIDDRIARELLDAINRPPKLKLVGSGTPNIQSVGEAKPA